MMISFDERAQIKAQVSQIVNKKYDDFGHIMYNITKGHRGISEDIQHNLLLTVTDNRKLLIQWSVLNYFELNRCHRFKVHLVNELGEYDDVNRLEFSEVMMKLCNNNPFFYNRIDFI